MVQGIRDSVCGLSGRSFKRCGGKFYFIDLKAREQGILEWCRESGIPFAVYPAEVLNDVEGSFTSSAFVKETTVVDNVCERSAILASDCGKKFYFFCICKRDNGSRQRVREKCNSCK